MNTNSASLNDAADDLLKKAEYSRALAMYQQVFLDCGKSSEPHLRAQVARALHGAARCYELMQKPDMATQIRETLFKRYGADDNPRTRYWIELAKGVSTRQDAAKIVSAAELESPETSDDENRDDAQGWEAFLKANDLEGESAPEADNPNDAGSTPPAPFLKSETPPAFLPENEVSLEQLQEIFKAAFFECDSDGEMLRVQMEGVRFLIHLDEANKMIVCEAIYALRKYAPTEEKHELANTLNRTLIFIRFVIQDETTFIAHYALPYMQGLLPIHLVGVLRLMHRVLTQSVGQYDKNDLLS